MTKIFPYLLLSFFFLMIGCPGAIDSIVRKELGHKYIYHEVLNVPIISKENPYKEIPSVVVSYDYNNNFIIALQKDLELPQQAKYDLITQGKYYDIAIEKGKSKYWIIVHSHDSIYGPYDKIEFNYKRKELGVSPNLILKEY